MDTNCYNGVWLKVVSLESLLEGRRERGRKGGKYKCVFSFFWQEANKIIFFTVVEVWVEKQKKKRLEYVCRKGATDKYLFYENETVEIPGIYNEGSRLSKTNTGREN